ncbi:MAG TPA: hypothetical protein VJL10_10175 [Anaerolineales bacterium]|nr:hypothetical protein [Anaerolineales bacterium]
MMKPLASDEKIALVMVYTPNMLVRGEVIVKESLRVSIWLRTQGIRNYVHILEPQIILFGGASPKTLQYSEIFVPIEKVLAFHLAPPAHEPLDYDEDETNRMMQAVDLVVGTFLMKAKLRISTQTDVATNLDISSTAWMSIYDAAVSNPYLPQFSAQAPMLLVNPGGVSIGLA